MRVRIKVCGFTRAEDIAAAVEAGVDAVGFVFADSVRRVTPEHAAELARLVPPFVACVAVFRHPDPGLIQEVVSIVRPDWVQSDALDRPLFRGRGVRFLPVLRDSTDGFPSAAEPQRSEEVLASPPHGPAASHQVSAVSTQPGPAHWVGTTQVLGPIFSAGRREVVEKDSILPGETLLYEGLRSGEGQRANWDRATELARTRRLVLAGGLDPSNVAAAVRHVRPFGVDVSSGVESHPGIKSPSKMRDFIEAVRDADPHCGAAATK
ncbi:MAG: phosphoribosylanthranilate isomerase [Planctomycetota bacterium]